MVLASLHLEQESVRKEGNQVIRIEEAGGSGTLIEGGLTTERHYEGQNDEEAVIPTSHSKTFMHLGHTANLAIRRAWIPGVEPRSALESGVWEGMPCNLHLLHLLVRISKP